MGAYSRNTGGAPGAENAKKLEICNFFHLLRFPQLLQTLLDWKNLTNLEKTHFIHQIGLSYRCSSGFFPSSPLRIISPKTNCVSLPQGRDWVGGWCRVSTEKNRHIKSIVVILNASDL